METLRSINSLFLSTESMVARILWREGGRGREGEREGEGERERGREREGGREEV